MVEIASADSQSTRRRIRVIALLHAADRAGLSPIPTTQLHTFAYLSNVLAPVWDMRTFDGKVLKRQRGPFYPAFQSDVDRLVGMAVVQISELNYYRDEIGWRLEGAYKLNAAFEGRIIKSLLNFEVEGRELEFVRELANAISALSDEELGRAVDQDATFADPLVDLGNIVDFAEWQSMNFSANAAKSFERLIPGVKRATRGEELHLYIRHLRRRLHGTS